MRPWDWRQRFQLTSFSITAATAGQPQVDWSAGYKTLPDGAEHTVRGHVEVRWSTGAFQGRPEAKIYLDTPHHEIPGYVSLGPQAPDQREGHLF
jgi:hypothetical protein